MIFCEILTLRALLDFERYKTGVPRIGNIQRPGHMDSSFLQMDSYGTGFPTTPTAQVPPFEFYH
jgi:hypothetical protein